MKPVKTDRFSVTCECGCTICAEWRSDTPGVWKQRVGACDARNACAGRSAETIIGIATWWHDLKAKIFGRATS